MSLINIGTLKIDGASVSKFFDKASKFLLHQPTWLKAALLCSIILGGFYYYYNYSNRNQSIKELQNEVKAINEKFLSEEIYQENLIYVITEIQLLQQEETQSYNDERLQLELLIKFIERHHPNDPIIADFQAMRSRLEVNHETYIQHYEHVMQLLKSSADSTYAYYSHR